MFTSCDQSLFLAVGSIYFKKSLFDIYYLKKSNKFYVAVSNKK